MKINLNNFNLNNFLKAVALTLTILIFFKSIIDVDKTWDTWNYHLPFAARIWGIVPETSYLFEDAIEHRFDGFPLLAEFLQGFFWFISRHLAAANLVSFLSLVIYGYFLKRIFQIPLYLSVLTLLAIPLVQIHATSCYVDLPGNIGISILVMMTYWFYTRRDLRTICTKSNVLIIFLSAAGAVNTKIVLTPIVFLILGLIAYRIIFLYLQQRQEIKLKSKWLLTLLPLACLATIFIFATPIKNTIFYGNPVYPVKIEIANIVLNYQEEPNKKTPNYLKDAPQYQRWVHSILGLTIFEEGKLRRWSIGQVKIPGGVPSDRMGGYCAIYVVFNLLLLAYLCYCDHSRETGFAATLVIVMSAVTSIMPQSHMLRFYMYWMISLISLNLYLLCRLEQSKPGKINTRIVGMVSIFILMIVIAGTDDIYVFPQFHTLAKHLDKNVNQDILNKIKEGNQVCIVDKQPNTFLYASKFYPPLNYLVKAARSVDQCGKYQAINK